MTESSDSDDLPLAARAQPNGRERKPAGAMAEADSASQGEGAEDKAADSDSDSESDVPLAVRQQAMNQQNGRRHKPVATKADDDSDEEDDDDDDDDADDDSEDDAGRKRKRITGTIRQHTGRPGWYPDAARAPTLCLLSNSVACLQVERLRQTGRPSERAQAPGPVRSPRHQKPSLPRRMIDLSSGRH